LFSEKQWMNDGYILLLASGEVYVFRDQWIPALMALGWKDI
jgi:hypothetical protein